MAGPLSNIRILDFTRMLAGPYCTMILGDMGAEVIKLEMPPQGDMTRTLGPPFLAGQSGYFMSVNRNKKSLVLNLKKPQGKKILRQLAERCDVVVENFRGGVTERLGIDYESLKTFNPSLIYCSISAFGETGPYKDNPAYDITIQALSGEISITGEPDGTMVKMGIPMGDLAGSFYGAIGILCALYERQFTGRGRKIDIGLLDANISLLSYMAGPFLIDGRSNRERPGTSHPNVVPWRMYKARDAHITMAIIGDDYWPKICRVLGIEEWGLREELRTNRQRVERRAEVDSKLEAAIAGFCSAELVERLNQCGIPAARVNTIDEALSDPQVIARDMVVTIDHPLCGAIKALGNPIKMPKADLGGFNPPPTLGQHTRQMLSELLAYSDEEIGRLQKTGVIGDDQAEKADTL